MAIITNFQYAKRGDYWKAGIALSFYDYYSGNWVAAHDALHDEYGFLATFIVLYETNAIYRTNYLILKANGHEIGSHTLNNQDYNAWGGTDQEFIDQEIIAHDTRLQGYGFDKLYTFGPVANSLETYSVHDHIMLDTKIKVIPIIESPFPVNTNEFRCLSNYWHITDNGLIIKSFGGLDVGYPFSNENIIMSLLQYAKNNNLIIALHGHDIQSSPGTAGIVDLNFLEEICDYVKSNNMTFYRYKDLINFVYPGPSIKPYFRKFSLTLTFKAGTQTTIAKTCYMDGIGDVTQDDYEYLWYISDDANGTNEELEGTGNTPNITPQVGDIGKFLRCVFRSKKNNIWSPYYSHNRIIITA